MQVFHTAGVPPSIGRIIFAIIGWTKKSKNALRKIATDQRTAIRYPVSPYYPNAISLPTSPIPLPTRPSPESSPVPPESSLTGSPILSLSDSAVGMPKVRPADPPEERECSDTRKERDPESHAFEVGLFERADTNVLAVGGQRDRSPIDSFSKMSASDRRMQIFAAHL